MERAKLRAFESDTVRVQLETRILRQLMHRYGDELWASMPSSEEIRRAWLAGAVGFYGRPGRMIDLVPKINAPILALQGGDDQGIPHEDNVAFEEALSAAGKDYELIEFEGAPHSFFDRKQEEFQVASDDAWHRTLEFIARNS